MQQQVYSNKNNADYNSIFRKHIIPIDQVGNNLYDANNIKLVSNPENIEPEIILIDSASRNWDKENNNNYTLKLDHTFQYVHSIELVDGYIPASGYIINDNNNAIHYQEKCHAPINVNINPGNYDIRALLKELSTTMTDNSPNHYIYKCTVDPHTNKVTITCDHNFNLFFTDGTEVVGDRGTMEIMAINPLTGHREPTVVTTSDDRRKYAKDSIGKILGFKPVNLENETHYTGQLCYELLPYKYLSLFLNTENADDFKKITAPSPDNGANGAFAVVSLVDNCYNINKYNHVIDNSRFIKTFNPPINFNKLRIQFRTVDGHLYDFNGIDHHLVFEIKRAFGREIITDLSNLK